MGIRTRPSILAVLNQPDNHLGGLGKALPDHADVTVRSASELRDDDEVLEAFDGAVVMGGSMYAYEDHVYPFLTAERTFIRRMHARNKPVLGVCLGAQLAAFALGGRARPAPPVELGWQPVLVRAGDELLGPPGARLLFLWHRDIVDPPPGASVLAVGPRCTQAFRMGSTFGVQFHPEVDAEHMRSWLSREDPEEIRRISGQHPEEIVAQTERLLPSATKLTAQIAAAFARLCGASRDSLSVSRKEAGSR